MNPKQLSILAVVAIVVGGIGFTVYKKQKASWEDSNSGQGGEIFAELPINDVAAMTIQATNGAVHLVKQGDGWVVKERDDYSADFDAISKFLRTLWELKAVQRPNVPASQLGRLHLVAPSEAEDPESSGVVVKLQGEAGNELATVTLGKQHMRKSQGNPAMGGGGSFPDGRYIMVGNDPSTVALVSEAFSSIKGDPKEWLDNKFFKLEKVRSISYEPAAKTNAWKVTRESETGDFSLVDAGENEELDTAKTSGFKWLMSSASFVDVVPRDNPAEETGLDQPTVAKVETFDGFQYVFKIGKQDEDENYHLAFDVEAEFPKPAEADKEAKKDGEEKQDNAEAGEEKTDLAELKQKLEQERKLAGNTYLVSKWTLDALMKPRSEIVKEKETPEESDGAAPAVEGPVPAPPLPGGATPPPLPPSAPDKKAPQEAAPEKSPEKEDGKADEGDASSDKNPEADSKESSDAPSGK